MPSPPVPAKQIKNIYIGKGKSTGKDIENRLSHSVGSGPDLVSLGHHQGEPTCRAGDNPHLDAKNVNGQSGCLAADHAAAILGQSNFGAFDLAFPSLTTKLPEYLSDLCRTGGTNRMALGQQTAARIHRGFPAERRHPLRQSSDRPRPAGKDRALHK